MIDAEVVKKMFMDCLYTAEEVEGLPEGKAPEGCVMIDGITTKFGLHPKRLEAYRKVVTAYLNQLPVSFRKSGGGGMSFLNACNLEDGTQWTGMHKRMEELFTMGMGLGIVAYATDKREIWTAFPGGMPYMIIDL
jgi:hypothetical protein